MFMLSRIINKDRKESFQLGLEIVVFVINFSLDFRSHVTLASSATEIKVYYRLKNSEKAQIAVYNSFFNCLL